MSAGALPQVPGLNELLRRCHGRVRRQLAVRGLANGILVLFCCLFAICLMDYLIALPAWTRAGLLLISVAVISIVVWRGLILPLLDSVSRRELGAAVDLSCPQMQEAVATLLSLEDPDATASEAGSAAMRYRVRQQVAAGLKHVVTGKVVDSHDTIRRCGLVACGMLLILLPLAFWPSGTWLLLQRTVMPWANLATVSNLYFEVPDADRYVAKNASALFIAMPRWRSGKSGRLPSEVHLQLKADDGKSDQLAMSYDETGERFVATLPGVQQSLTYRIEGGGAVTEWFRLNVEPAPEILSALLKETPPAYTGRAVEITDGMVGDLEVFERSELEIALAFSKPVKQIQLVWSDYRPIATEVAEDELPEELRDLPNPNDPSKEVRDSLVMLPEILSADGLSAVFRTTALGSGRFEFQVLDHVGLSNPSEPERRLLVVEDRAPELMVTGVRDGMELRPDAIVPLDCRVVDDIGVGLLEMHFQKNQEAVRIEPAAGLVRGSLSLEHSFRLSLETLQLQDGDTVSIRIRTGDERPVPEPNTVWKGPWTIGVRNDAEALGSAALKEADQQLIDQLKQIEEQLDQDARRAAELKNQLWQQWDDEGRAAVRQLSEKAQLQGRQLQTLSEQVAEHPLMQKQAEDLNKLGETVREHIPVPLDEAARSERNQAAGRIQESAQELNRARDQLHQTIQEIERLARLEQELTELNRLALEAEELAKQAEELQEKQTRRQPEPGQTEEELLSELQQGRQQVEDERQQLTSELSDLLGRNQELLDSARQSQLDRLKELADEAQQLAGQQQQVADGVNAEANEAARAAAALANQLSQLQNQLRQLKNQADKATPDMSLPEAERLDDALRALRHGNLAEARQGMLDTQQQLKQSVKDLAGRDDASPDQQQIAERTRQLADDFEALRQQVDALRSDRNVETDTNAPAVPDQQAAESSSAAEQLITRLKQLNESGAALAESLQQDPSVERSARQHAQQAARRSQEAVDAAASGQFSKAAERMRQSATEGIQSAEQLTEQQQDRREQLQNTAQELHRLADTIQDLQQNESARTAAQQQSQQELAERAAELPSQLGDLSERFHLPALAMEQQGRQAQEAQQSAGEAATSGQQASDQLQQAELRRSADSARNAAAQLNRTAQLARQGSQQNEKAESPVPADVGESVTDALQSLDRAGKMAGDPAAEVTSENRSENNAGETAAMPGQENAAGKEPGAATDNAASDNADNSAANAGGETDDQPSPGGQNEESDSGQAGTKGAATNQPGKPSDQTGTEPGQASAQQLSQAAKALASAARGALPQPFTPGQMTDAQESSAARQGTGNDQGWDGQMPGSTRTPGGLWLRGLLQDQLEDGLSEVNRDVVDQEYSELIRRYRRELARAAAGRTGNTAPNAD